MMINIPPIITRIFSKKRLQLSFMLVATLVLINNSLVVVFADSPDVSNDNQMSLEDLQSVHGGWGWFNTTLNRCEVGDGAATTATGPAADLLTKAGLDPQWVNVIVKYAAVSNTDPIAMASLLFWENRGFPAYKGTGWSDSGSVGSGPWQITAGTWPSSAGPYSYADDPVASTKVAADIVAHYGGVAGYSLGSINQDFSKGSNLKTIATLAKNYNAGQGSWRTPGVADWMAAGRTWFGGGNGTSDWGSTKAGIIDDYVVAMTYAYYQIASGTKMTFTGDGDAYVKEGNAHVKDIENFAWKPGSGAGSGSAPTPTNNDSAKPVIVLDPGHADNTDIKVDPQSNIAVLDYSNKPGREIYDVWDVANQVKTQLETAGYQVYLTKDNVDGTDPNTGKPNTDLKQRAVVGTQKQAALGISIHTTPDNSSHNQNMNFIPAIGNWRETSDGQTKKYYSNTDLANQDAKMAATFQQTRATALGIDTKDIRVGSYEDLENGPRDTSVPGITSIGTVLVTQYFATTPWMYFEQAQDGPNDSLKSTTLAAYVKGIVDGVKQAVPTTGNATATGSCNGGTDSGIGQGSIVKTALAYAWDTPGHGINRADAKPAYQDAMPKYDGATDYNPYSDCGVFVATVMISSGADPNYPKRGTIVQEVYVSSHPDLYKQIKATSTADLEPGDIFLVNGVGSDGNMQGHTYIYTGTYTGGDGKKYNAAAASLNGHVPEADQTYFSQDGVKFTIWRLLKQP